MSATGRLIPERCVFIICYSAEVTTFRAVAGGTYSVVAMSDIKKHPLQVSIKYESFQLRLLRYELCYDVLLHLQKVTVALYVRSKTTSLEAIPRCATNESYLDGRCQLCD